MIRKKKGVLVSVTFKRDHCIHYVPFHIVVLWISSMELNTATSVKMLDEAVCISHSGNTIRKGMHPIILPPVKGK